MELTCFEVEPGRVTLRPAGTSRQWMDDTPGRFAYRCQPITVANGHGWEMLCPADFEVTWNGGSGIDDLQIRSDAPMAAESSNDYMAFLLGKSPGDGLNDKPDEDVVPASFFESHFGSGILTFNPMVILRTPPGYHLWVTGPVNYFKDAIQPMSALIESDWMPFTFSMNWKVTRPNTPITFHKGEPFCAFFPSEGSLTEFPEPKMRNLSDDPEMQKAYWAARVERTRSSLTSADDKERFQNWYARMRREREE